MNIHPFIRRALLAAAFYAGGVGGLLHAGTYTNNFDAGSTAGLTIYSFGVGSQGAGAPGVVASGGNPGGYFKLTDAVGSANATVVFPDFEPGFSIEAFTFEVDSRLGDGTTPPADGFSINFVRPGDELLTRGNGFSAPPAAGEVISGGPFPLAPFTGADANGLPEEGSKTGLAIGFDTWNSSNGDVVGISVKLDGGLIMDDVPLPTVNGAIDDPTSGQTGPVGSAGWAPFKVELKSDATLTITWKNTVLVDNIPTGWTPSPGRIVFAARTGGSWQKHHFDNLSLVTVPSPKATLTGSVLTNNGYALQVTDFVAVNPGDPQSLFQATTTGANAIALEIDGAAITLAPSNVSKIGAITTITYVPPTAPSPGSTHTFTVTGKDNNGAAIVGSGSVRAPYFPPTVAGPSGAVGSWGIREWYSPAALPGAGLGPIVELIQNLGPSDPGVIEATGVPVLNHSDPQSPGGRGNFNNDFPFIGDTEADDNNVVVVGKTQVTVPAPGQYTFAVHSDDGYGLRISGGPVGNTSKFVKIYGGGNEIDVGDAQTAAFAGYTGDANGHAVYDFTAAGTYDVLFVSFEGGVGAFWEVAWAPGDFQRDRDTNTWALVGNPAAPSLPSYTPRWLTEVPGPDGTAGNWGLRTYLQAGSVDNLAQTSEFLRNTFRSPGDADGLTNDVSRPVLNASDGGSNGTIGDDDAIPTGDAGGNGTLDRVVTVAKGRLNITTASDYTFWARGDDGFLLRLKGVNGVPNPSFKQASNGDPAQDQGRFEASNPNELFFEGGTGDSNTRAVVALGVGQYDVEYIHWEGTGGFWYELAAAQGAFLHGVEPPNGWRLVGYNAPLATLAVPGLSGQWAVESSSTGRAEFVFDDLDAANAAIDATLVDETVPAAKSSLWDSINFTDPESGGGSSYTPDNPWPLDTVGIDDNNYAMRAAGSLVITVPGDYNIGFQGDDGGYMDISGPGTPQWSSIVFTNHAAQALITEAVPGSGINNRLQVVVGTGNSRTIGKVTLAAGTYTINTLVYEGSGGSWWEVFGSQAPAGAIGLNYQLLATGAGSTYADSDGLQLVGRATGSIAITAFSFNPSTGAYSVTFTSEAGANYAVQYTNGLQAGATGTAARWNVVPTAASVSGSIGTTTVNGTITGLVAPAGLLPDASTSFFRVQKL